MKTGPRVLPGRTWKDEMPLVAEGMDPIGEPASRRNPPAGRSGPAPLSTFSPPRYARNLTQRNQAAKPVEKRMQAKL